MEESKPNTRKPSAGFTDRKPAARKDGAQSAGASDRPRPGTRSTQTGGQRPYPHREDDRPQGRTRAGAPHQRGDGPHGGRPQSASRAAPQEGARPRPGKPEGSGSESDGGAPPSGIQLKKVDMGAYGKGYRGSSSRAAGSNRGNSPNRQSRKPVTKAATHRQPMLNTHRIAPFKYDMNEILSSSSMDPSMAASFLATVIAKASRISSKEAKDCAKAFLDDGNLTKDEYDRISRLLDRYSKYR